MAVRRLNQVFAYGVGDSLIPLAPLPIIAQRDPTSGDLAELATVWVNNITGAVFMLSSITANSANWSTSAVSGNIICLSVDITAGSLVIDPGAGGIDVGGGAFTVDNSGDVFIGGNLDVAGTFTFSGTLNLVSPAAILVESTFNGAPSILIEANGGASEQIVLTSLQGTAVDSIEIESISGGIEVISGKNTAAAVHLIASAGGVTASAGTAGITLAATNGAIALTSGTGAINIGADAVQHAITLGNSTGNTSIALNAGTGALNIGTNAIAHVVTIGNIIGATAVNINTGTAGCALTTTNGAVVVHSGTGAINIGTDAVQHVVTLGNVTGNTAVNINTGTGGSTLTATNGPVAVTSGTGQIDISSDAAATTVNLGIGAAVKAVVVGSTTAASTTTVQAPAGGVILGGVAGHVVSNQNLVTIDTVSGALGSVASTTIYPQVASVTLTAAQVRALDATPITIVATPGANKFLSVISASGVMKYGGTNQFTSGGTANVSVIYKDLTGVQIATPVLADATIVAAATTLEWTHAVAQDNVAELATAVANQPLVVGNLGGAIAGNAANDNTVTITVSYYIMSF